MIALSQAALLDPQFRSRLGRGALAGAAWGFAVAAGLTAQTALACGGICISETAATAALSVGVGIAAFSPLTALAARH